MHIIFLPSPPLHPLPHIAIQVDKEINETNFVAQCIYQGGNNASKDHFKGVQKEMLCLIIKYNCATLIRHWWATRGLFWRMLRHKKGQTAKVHWLSKPYWRMTVPEQSDSTIDYCQGVLADDSTDDCTNEAAGRIPLPAVVVEPPVSASATRFISIRGFR